MIICLAAYLKHSMTPCLTNLISHIARLRTRSGPSGRRNRSSSDTSTNQSSTMADDDPSISVEDLNAQVETGPEESMADNAEVRTLGLLMSFGRSSRPACIYRPSCLRRHQLYPERIPLGHSRLSPDHLLHHPRPHPQPFQTLRTLKRVKTWTETCSGRFL